MRLFLRRFSVLCGLQLFALLGMALATAGNVCAATLTVTTTADSGTGSLRDTIVAASNGDTIQFAAALNGQTITLTSGELVIDKNITVSGPGPDLLAVSRASNLGRFRIFHIMPSRTVIIEGLTISSGYASGALGGGIFNDQSTLTISNCTLSGNFSDAGAGGGGIYNRVGTLTIVNSIVRFNRAGFTTGNPLGYGGGILSGGTLTIIHSTISGNRAGSEALEFSGYGGGIENGGTLEITNSTVSGNTAQGNASGVGGGILISGNSGPVTITNSTISGNFAYDNGGGISNGAPLTITHSTVSGNTAGTGGGIVNGGTNAALEIGNTILKAGASGAKHL
jgi:hypothetical protein